MAPPSHPLPRKGLPMTISRRDFLNGVALTIAAGLT
ncbi:twin-arginine translocation signal domain-containing protein, partial [Stenotrophomonas maltophilia]